VWHVLAALPLGAKLFGAGSLAATAATVATTGTSNTSVLVALISAVGLALSTVGGIWLQRRNSSSNARDDKLASHIYDDLRAKDTVIAERDAQLDRREQRIDRLERLLTAHGIEVPR
jgi:uncharacterized protein HemX